MQNFQDTFKTRNRSFIGAFSICMTVPLTFVILLFVLIKLSLAVAFMLRNSTRLFYLTITTVCLS